MWRLLVPGLCTFLTIATPALAANEAILILPLEGESGKRLDAVLRASLPPGLPQVPVAQAGRAGRLLRERSPTTGEAEAYAIVTRRLEASALLEGTVSQGEGWTLRLAMRRGDDGTVLGTERWSAATLADLAAVVDRAVPGWVNNMLAQMGARAPDIPTEPPPVTLGPAAAPRGSVGRPRGSTTDPFEERSDPFEQGEPEPSQANWEISIGPRVFARTFKYSQNRAGLPGFSLVGAAAIAGEATVYPAASLTSWVRDLGLSGAMMTSLGAKTAARNGGSHDTALRAFRLGPWYRHRRADLFGGLLLEGGVHVGQDWVEIDAPAETPPNVRYTFLRPAAGGRLDVTPKLSASLSLAYLHVFSVGELGSAARFPHDTAVGVEVGAGLGYTVDDSFELRLIGDFRRFAHAMNFQTGDPYAVGGALDQHFGLALLVAYRGR